MPRQGHTPMNNGYNTSPKRPQFTLPQRCRLIDILTLAGMYADPTTLESGFSLMRAPNGAEPPGSPRHGGYVIKHYGDLAPGEINFVLE